MYQVFCRAGLLTDIPVMKSNEASFSKLQHAVNYIEKYKDNNFWFISTLDDTCKEYIIMIFAGDVKTRECKGSKTEKFLTIVPWWEQNIIYKGR